MNDSPANTTTDNTTTDNSDATDILATKEEEDTPPPNNDNISNNDAPSTNDKELLGEPTTTIDGTPQPQIIEEAPSSPIKQLINKFNQSHPSNNNNDSIQSSAPAVADEVGEEEDVENLTEDEYDQLDNDNDIAMDVVPEEEVEEDEEIEEGVAKDDEEVVEGETATDNSIAVQTAAVQNEVVDLQDLDTDNGDLTAANKEKEEIKVADAEVERHG